MGFTVAVWDSGGRDDPKIQIWREAKTQPSVYHKISYDIPISNTTSPCYQRTLNATSGIFQCTLQEDFRISVQPGDFLGLEIPPMQRWYYLLRIMEGFVIYSKSGGPTSLVFQGRLGSQTVNLFTEPYNITNDEPQITFLVALGKEFLY